jgi:hypothetical protein
MSVLNFGRMTINEFYVYSFGTEKPRVLIIKSNHLIVDKKINMIPIQYTSMGYVDRT